MEQKTKFAAPTDRDMRFVRNSKSRQEDFDELDAMATTTDGFIFILLLIGILGLVGVFTL